MMMAVDERRPQFFRIAVLRLVLVLGLMPLVAPGDEFRLSFLNEAPALQDTCRVLREAGVSQSAVATFQRLVTGQNQLGNRVSAGKFPRARGGFYRFQDVNDLVRRLPAPFGRQTVGTTPENRTLMCFDVAALLLRGAGYGTPRLEQEFESNGIVLPVAGGPIKNWRYEAFRTGYLLALCPEKDYLRWVGQPRSADETQLELSLIAPRSLEGAATGRERDIRAAWESIHRAMERSGFAYGGKLQVGFVYPADFKGHVLSADHAFVCIPQKEHWICVEKTSPTGPFVRADFKSTQDLARYEAATYLDFPLAAGQSGYDCPIIVTLDNGIIQIFRPTGGRTALRLPRVQCGLVRLSLAGVWGAETEFAPRRFVLPPSVGPTPFALCQ